MKSRCVVRKSHARLNTIDFTAALLFLKRAVNR
jgi:hypothetical protein